MSGWSGFTALAKSAINTAQKQIDKALEIKEGEEGSEHKEQIEIADGDDGKETARPSPSGVQRLQDDLFTAFGLSSFQSPDDPEESSNWSQWLGSKNPSQKWSNWLGAVPPEHDSPPLDDPSIGKLERVPEEIEPPLEKRQRTPTIQSYEEVELLTPIGSQPFDSGRLGFHESSIDSESLVPIIDSSAIIDWQNESTFDWSQPFNPSNSETLLTSVDSDATLKSLAQELAESQNLLLDEPKSLEVDVSDCVSAVIERVVADISPADARPVAVTAHGASSDNSESPQSSPPLLASSVMKGSGYTSPTDVESSDIEIISTPNGDNMSERSSRSGVLMGWTTVPRMEGHHRVNSDQSQGLCDIGGASHDPQDKKAMHLAQILENRELKLIEMSRENMRLVDENEALRFSLAESQNSGLDEALQNLREKYSGVCEERDSWKSKSEAQTKETESAHLSLKQMQKVVQQKDEQVTELQTEGEKLSKQELKHTTIIKKLRQKEKETEKSMETQKAKLAEMDALKQKLKDKEEQELKYDEMVSNLKSQNDKLEKRLKETTTAIEEAKEKERSLQNSVESCYRQISELQREKANKEAEVQSIKSQVDASKETELQGRLEMLQKETASERQDLLNQCEELRLNLVQSNEESTRRESSFKWEIGQLHKKLQDADMRNQELSEGVSAATVPLLRQIESLQSSHTIQQSNWERLEKALYDRIHTSERQLSEGAEREREQTNEQLQLQSDINKLKTQLSNAQAETTQLKSQVNAFAEEKSAIEQTRLKHNSELEHERALHRKAIEDLQKEKELLQAQFDFEKNQIKAQCQRDVATLNATLEEKELNLASMRSQLLEQQLAQERNIAAPVVPDRSVSPPSVQSFNPLDQVDDYWFDLAGPGGFSTLVERLRTKLHQREAEVNVLKDEVSSLQTNRDSMGNQVSTLQRTVYEIEERLVEHEDLVMQHKELNDRYQALLTMYGEKVEQNDELKLDLQDVKAMFRQQIEDLIRQNSNQ